MKEKIIVILKDSLQAAYSTTSLLPKTKIATFAQNITEAESILATATPLKAAVNSPAINSAVTDSMQSGLNAFANAATTSASAVGSSIMNFFNAVYGYRTLIGTLLAIGSTYLLYRKYRQDHTSASANVTVNVNCNHTPGTNPVEKVTIKPQVKPKSKSLKSKPITKIKAPLTKKLDPKSEPVTKESDNKLKPQTTSISDASSNTDLKPEVSKALVVPITTTSSTLSMPLFEQHRENDEQLTEKVVVCRPLTLGAVNIGLLCRPEVLPLPATQKTPAMRTTG